MQVVFNTIVEFYDEMESTIVEIGKSSLVLPYIKQDVCFQIPIFQNLSIIFYISNIFETTNVSILNIVSIYWR